jgi:hypothetical protein
MRNIALNTGGGTDYSEIKRWYESEKNMAE